MKQMSSYNNSQSPSSSLPFGGFKNETTPGAHDGTNIVAEHLQDIYYCLYQVLQLAGFTPNGNLEDGNTSKQFIGALANIGIVKYASTITYSQNTIVLKPGTVQLWKSKIDNNVGNALSEGANWTLLIDFASLKAEQLPTLSNNVTDPNNDIDVTAGFLRNLANTGWINLSSALTKRFDANWTAGNNQGAFIPITGHTSKEVSTWYNVFAITNGITSDVCCIHYSGCDSSDGRLLTAAGKTAVAAQTSWNESDIIYSWVGSIKTNASGNNIPIFQFGDYFFYKTPTLDITGTTNITSSRNLYTIPVPPYMRCIAIFNARHRNANDLKTYICNPDFTDLAPQDDSAAPLSTIVNVGGPSDANGQGNIHVLTNLLSQIAIRSSATGGLDLCVIGYKVLRR